ncbi:MAG: MaoC/PaaZ C-terminal domain-containing protein [Parvibaculaceae bacterium]
MREALPPPPDFVFGPVTRTDLVRYAGASGDFNPLHHDETFAREAGLPSVMAHGMLSAGLLGSFLSAWMEGRFVRRFRVRFVAPVWPGDVLRAEGSVMREMTEARGFELALRLRRQDGAEVVTGTALVDADRWGTKS